MSCVCDVHRHDVVHGAPPDVQLPSSLKIFSDSNLIVSIVTTMPGGMGFAPSQLTLAHCCAPLVGIASPPPIGSDGRLATGPASTVFPGGSGPVPSGDGVVSASDDEVTVGDASVSDDTADADLLGVTSDLPQPTPITASTETTTTRGAQRPRWFRSFKASPPFITREAKLGRQIQGGQRMLRIGSTP